MSSNFQSFQSISVIKPNNAPFSPIGKRHFLGMLMVMLLTLLYVTYVTQFQKREEFQESVVLEKTSLIFKDDTNGDILIEVSKDKLNNMESQPQMRLSGEQGFLRGTIRALARERKARNLSHEIPFDLELHQDGRLSIKDPLTNSFIALEAFGPDNVDVFVKIFAQSKKHIINENKDSDLNEISKEMK